MNQSIIGRIRVLEAKNRKNPLIVRACSGSGETVVLPMVECLRRGYSFERVVSGSSLDDLDLLLQSIYNTAKERRGMKK